MKNVSIRIPEAAPFGETFLEASVLAIVAAFFVNNPAGGAVDSVVTRATHFFRVRFGFLRVLRGIPIPKNSKKKFQ
jgi:hypothetical protein